MSGSAGAEKIARRDGFAASMLKDVEIPPMALLRQRFDAEAVDDVPAALVRELRRSGVLDALAPGMAIAVTGGSRGIASYGELMATLVRELKKAGTRPFIFPAMGSHGGASAEGQLEVLGKLGIAEESMGCPVRASMETIRIDATDDGQAIYADKLAWEADGIVLLNRIKCHTGFVGPFESGLVKMSVIGLGKQKGAEACHARGLEHMSANIRAMAGKLFSHGKIHFGVGTVENQNDRVKLIRVLPAARIFDEEPELLRIAKASMPSLPIAETDVLVVDAVGKNFSGGGMDPHVVGRFVVPSMRGGIASQRLVVLDISDESKGSGIGLGRADLTTQRAFRKFDFEQTYPNALTSNVLEPSRLPIVMGSDRLAVAAAIKTCVAVDRGAIRMVRIRNSLDIEEFHVTENLIDEAMSSGRVEMVEAPKELRFDMRGDLF